jgi:hypothetical protein
VLYAERRAAVDEYHSKENEVEADRRLRLFWREKPFVEESQARSPY